MLDSNIQVTDPQTQQSGEEFVEHRKLRREIESLRKAEESRRWDSLDIENLIEASLDAFANEFYGCPWDEMKDREALRVLSAFRDHISHLRQAQASPSVALQPGKGACRNAAAVSCESGGVRASSERRRQDELDQLIDRHEKITGEHWLDGRVRR